VLRRFRKWWRRHWHGSNMMAAEIEGRVYEHNDEDDE
jgi:hypothetical protein